MADKKRDYYEVLEIPKTASENDIKKAFRTLAKKLHPDANPNDKTAEAKFKEVNEAYSVLSDADKKARYDQFGHAGVDPSYGAGGSGFGGFESGFDMGDIFGDIFGGVFGGSSRRSRYSNSPAKGEDVAYRVTLTFEEAAFGCNKDVSYNRVERCTTCSGSGAAKGSSPETCPTCRGSGQVTTQQRTPFGVMQSSRVCENCRGKGKIVSQPCSDCHGTGYNKKLKKLEVAIPAGIDDGQRIALSGQGNAGENNGPNGDLIVVISVRPHHIFERDGYNLHCEVPITFVEATLGAKIIIPTLDGKGELTIPEGTQSGTVFAVKSKGIQNINGKGKGDLFVTVEIEVPKNLNKKQKEALEAFGNSCDDKNYTKKQSFFSKFKK
ncbi:MAG: molecular chaperone DnaJ [Clostridiales bacterium GWF2_36_10]|nr:MAG: molecular chaperone DnaJ [Clostridiales bacterium GWF2_36_10]HAN20224.1 molecular chaperone DnaJ [Clostridiales bacterium]